jgi:hypothetical protein
MSQTICLNGKLRHVTNTSTAHRRKFANGKAYDIEMDLRIITRSDIAYLAGRNSSTSSSYIGVSLNADDDAGSRSCENGAGATTRLSVSRAGEAGKRHRDRI